MRAQRSYFVLSTSSLVSHVDATGRQLSFLQTPDGDFGGVCRADDRLPQLPRRIFVEFAGNGGFGCRRAGRADSAHNAD